MSLFLLQLSYVQLEGGAQQKPVFVCYFGTENGGKANRNYCAITQANILFYNDKSK